MKLAIRPAARIAVGVAVLAVAVAVLLLSAGSLAHASDHPGSARRGQPCATAGAVMNDRSGDPYICEQRPGDQCKAWHAHRPKPGPWPSVSPCVCPTKSPSVSPSKSPSVSPSASTSPSKSASVVPFTSKPASPKPSHRWAPVHRS